MTHTKQLLSLTLLFALGACTGQVDPYSSEGSEDSAFSEGTSSEGLRGCVSPSARNPQPLFVFSADEESEGEAFFAASADNRGSNAYAGISLYLYEQRNGGPWEFRGTEWASVPPDVFSAPVHMPVTLRRGSNWSAVAYVWDPCNEEYIQRATTFIGGRVPTIEVERHPAGYDNYFTRTRRLFQGRICYSNFVEGRCEELELREDEITTDEYVKWLFVALRRVSGGR